MTLSRISAFGLVLLVPAMGAAALDTPHALHPHKAAPAHLSEARRATAHHAASPAAKSSSNHSSTAHATPSHTTAKTAPAHLTPRGQSRASARRAALTSRHHHYYERFTASSFANGDIFSGDITTGEDPVVRDRAYPSSYPRAGIHPDPHMTVSR